MGEVSNRDAAWADAKLRELLRDCIAWTICMQMAELGLKPEL